MEEYTKDIGKITRWKGLVNSIGLMDKYIQENIKKIKNMELEWFIFKGKLKYRNFMKEDSQVPKIFKSS